MPDGAPAGPSGPARIGIIGAGFWSAYFYLPYLRDRDDATCVGVVRRNREALDALQRGFELEVATPDVDELLAAGLDGVIVASAHTAHREHAEAALEAGCHVLIEKPMTLAHADSLALVAAAERAGRTLTVAYGYNHLRMAAWAVDIARRGSLGRITHISGLMSSSLTGLLSGAEGYGVVEVGGYPFEASPDTWADPERGGGYLYGQTSHQLGLALAVLGKRPERVFARLGLLPNGADADVSLSVEFEDGAIGTFAGHGRMPWGVRGRMSLVMEGERGVLTLDFEHERATLHLHHDGPRALPGGNRGQAFTGVDPDDAIVLEPGEGLYSCEGPAALLIDRCLGRDTPDPAPGTLGADCVAIMEAALRSAREGRMIEVAELAPA